MFVQMYCILLFITYFYLLRVICHPQQARAFLTIHFYHII